MDKEYQIDEIENKIKELIERKEKNILITK